MFQMSLIGKKARREVRRYQLSEFYNLSDLPEDAEENCLSNLHVISVKFVSEKINGTVSQL